MNFSQVQVGDFDEHFVITYEPVANALIPPAGVARTTDGEALRIASLLYHHVRTDDYDYMTLLHLAGWLQEWALCNGAAAYMLANFDHVCRELADVVATESEDDRPAGLDFDEGFKDVDYATSIEQIICWVTEVVASRNKVPL